MVRVGGGWDTLEHCTYYCCSSKRKQPNEYITYLFLLFFPCSPLKIWISTILADVVRVSERSSERGSQREREAEKKPEPEPEQELSMPAARQLARECIVRCAQLVLFFLAILLLLILPCTSSFLPLFSFFTISFPFSSSLFLSFSPFAFTCLYCVVMILLRVQQSAHCAPIAVCNAIRRLASFILAILR